jgi:hypothetical protein
MAPPPAENEKLDCALLSFENVKRKAANRIK